MKTHYIEVDGVNYPVNYERKQCIGFIRHTITYSKGRKQVRMSGESLDKVVETFKGVIRDGNSRRTNN